MDDPTQLLDAFIKEKRAEVEAFRMRWLEAHHKAPDAYPLEMEPGLWDEQFMDFDAHAGPFDLPEEDGL